MVILTGMVWADMVNIIWVGIIGSWYDGVGMGKRIVKEMWAKRRVMAMMMMVCWNFAPKKGGVIFLKRQVFIL